MFNRKPEPTQPPHGSVVVGINKLLDERLGLLNHNLSLTLQTLGQLEQKKMEAKARYFGEINEVFKDLVHYITLLSESCLKLESKVGSIEADALKQDLAGKVATFEQNSATDIKALAMRFSSNIAAREINSIARTNNSCSSRPEFALMPLHSIYKNEPIVGFPKTVAEFRALTSSEIIRFLGELDDPYCQPYYGTPSEKLQRLCLLVGVSMPTQTSIPSATPAVVHSDAPVGIAHDETWKESESKKGTSGQSRIVPRTPPRGRKSN